MVPYHNPIPEKKPQSSSPGSQRQGSGGSGLLGAWVQAEKMIQIALVLPGAAAIGWLLGAWADRSFHQSWMTVAGVLLGAVSGLTYTIRMAIAAERASDSGSTSQDGTDSQDETGAGLPGAKP